MRQRGDFCLCKNKGKNFTFMASIVEIQKKGLSVEIRTQREGEPAVNSQCSLDDLEQCRIYLEGVHDHLGGFEVEYLYLPRWISQKLWSQRVSEWMEQK